MVKYTYEDLQKEFESWRSGSIKRNEMTTKQWAAMKRRINRAGFKKVNTDYITSKKHCTRLEWLAKHAEYQRLRYAVKKKNTKLADTIDVPPK
jgi:diphthamide synthase (EF-2-diphthine--ammonia ligase)